MDTFTAVAKARAAKLTESLAEAQSQASIRYVFNPIFDMIISSLQTIVPKGRITPISEQGQPVGEVYLMTLVRDGETLDRAKYNLRDGVGEVVINPAPLVDDLLSQYGPQGAIQVKSLFNLNIDRFEALQLNDLIFGDREYETAEEYRERFGFVRQEARDASFSPLLNRVLLEIEASVDAAFAWAKAKSEWANQALKSGEIRRFSPFDQKNFKFSGITPIDEAMHRVALDQAALSHSLPEILHGLKEAAKPDWKEIGSALAVGLKDAIQPQSQPDWKEIGSAIAAGLKEGTAQSEDTAAPAKKRRN